MSKARQSGKTGLEVFADTVKTASGRGPAPVHLWNPPYCGDIDMRIASDGTWFYQGTPIGRPALIQLFASILKREGDKFFLVTPVEKCGIVVDDAPFMAVELNMGEGGAGRELYFRTNVGEWVTCGPGHALRGGLRRNGLAVIVSLAAASIVAGRLRPRSQRRQTRRRLSHRYGESLLPRAAPECTGQPIKRIEMRTYAQIGGSRMSGTRLHHLRS